VDEQQLINRSLSLIAGGDLEAAEAAAEQVLGTNPASVPALRVLAQIRSKQGQPHQTIALLRRALGFIEAAKRREDSHGVDNDDLAYMVEQAGRHTMMDRELSPDAGEVDVPDIFVSQAAGITYSVDVPTTPQAAGSQQVEARQSPPQLPTPAESNGIHINPWGFLTSEFAPLTIDSAPVQLNPSHAADQGEPPSVSGNRLLHGDEDSADFLTGFVEGSEEDANWDPEDGGSGSDDEFCLEQSPDSAALDEWADDVGEPDFYGDMHAPDWDQYAAADAAASENSWDNGAATYEDVYLPPGSNADYGDARVSRAERAMQVAVQVAEDYGWDKRAVHLLADIFEQNYWSAAQVAVRREIENGLTPQELALANEIRQMWFRRCEFWVTASVTGEIRQKYSILTWPSALAILRSFQGYPQTEEVESLLDDCLEQWMESRVLRLRFPAFFGFVLYRTGSKGDLTGIDGWFTFKDMPDEDGDYSDQDLASRLTRHTRQGRRKTQQALRAAAASFHAERASAARVSGWSSSQTDRTQHEANWEDAC